jgi:type II secretory pathway pseudopilin PulG
MIVVAIIGLLLGILIPAAVAARRLAMEMETATRIATLETAVELYRQDFGENPPSSMGGWADDWAGAELLAILLTGYGPDEDPAGIPGDDLDTDDGKDGFGYRVRDRGPVYGPYNGTEDLDRDTNDDFEQPVFVDVWERPILYYRFTGSGYSGGHNPRGPGSFNAYVENDADEFYRRDYILISRGDDGEWQSPSNADSDDITNFTE